MKDFIKLQIEAARGRHNRPPVKRKCIHTDETDDIIRKHNGNIKATCKELGWGNNREVRRRAIELGIIRDEPRKGGPAIKYIPTLETDAVMLKHPKQLKKCGILLDWDVQAVRRRMVELGIIKEGKKIKTNKYHHTKKTDDLIRQYKGHTSTLNRILQWPPEIILDRAMILGVRKKGEHISRDFKYIDWTAIDEAIWRHHGYVIPIANETGWGKSTIRKRAEQLGALPKQNGNPYTYQKMYIPTPEIDAIIEATWREKYQNGGAVLNAVERITEHAKATKTPLWSESAVVTRARELGLIKGRKVSHGMKWQDGENKIILTHAHMRIATIQHKLQDAFPFNNRTQGAIQGQLNRLRAEYGTEGYTQAELSRNLHMAAKRLLGLTSQGIIKGVQRDTTRPDGSGLWYYSNTAVRNFILEYPEEIDTVVIDKYWLLDIVSGGKLGKKAKARNAEIKKTTKTFYATA